MRSPSPGLTAAVALLLACAGSALANPSTKQNTATYTAFDALTASVRHANGRPGVLTVQGGLDVQDPVLRGRAAASGPLLRDAYVRTLSVYAAALVPGALPDIDQIGLRLQRATDQVLHRPGAKVLLGTVLVN